MNILFVNYGDFTTNSLNHIAGFAGTMAGKGHACIVAVPDHKESYRSVVDRRFAPALYSELLEEPHAFPDGRAADLIHAWTPRERVRRFVIEYLQRNTAPLIIHLEDNEAHLLELFTRRPLSELKGITDAGLREIWSQGLSHPSRFESFLQIADGATVITEKLIETLPSGLPHHLLYPGVDFTFFQAPADAKTLRRELKVADDEKLLFFPGSQTFANRDDIRDLFMAVKLINQRGVRCRLVRTGFSDPSFADRAGFDYSEFVSELGFVEKHQLPRWMAAADILVQPGKPGPFNDYRLPSKIPEFLSAGRPVVLPASNIGLKMEDGREALLLASGSPEEIAEKCMQIFSDDSLRRSLCVNGSAFARRYFDLEQNTEQLLRFYTSLSAERQPPRASSLRNSHQSEAWVQIHLQAAQAADLPELRRALNRAEEQIRYLDASLTAELKQADEFLDLKTETAETRRCLHQAEQALAEARTQLANAARRENLLQADLVESQRTLAQTISEAETRLRHLTQARSQLDRSERRLAELEAEQSANARRLAEVSGKIRRMQRSVSWQLTSPLRFLRRHLLDPFRKEPPPVPASPKPPTPTPGSSAAEQPPHAPGVAPDAREESLDYARWIGKYGTPSAQDLLRMEEAVKTFALRPKISVLLPVFNSPEAFLRQAIESVRAQLYWNWELCIADDASTAPHVRPLLEHYASLDRRIRLGLRPENGHISESSNTALSLSTGEWVALLDHDDVLAPTALFHLVEAMQRHSQAALIYTDEDKIGADGVRYDPYFKPDWNPDLLLGQNYLCHLCAIRTNSVRQAGGFRRGFEGSQDWDLFLRVTEGLSANQIVHVPRVLYHWRSIPGSTAHLLDEKPYASQAAEKALREHLARRGIQAALERVKGGHWRIRRCVPDPAPSVSIIIPTRNQRKLLETCICSLQRKTSYPQFEILVVDNGSDEAGAQEYLREIEQQGVRVITYDSHFNFSAINNFAAQQARGKILAFLNNDLEVISDDWLTEMVGHAVRPEIGAVGALLYYPDDTVQHAGVVLGIGGVAGHAFKRFPRGHAGDKNRLRLVQNYSAVTAACLVVRREVFQEVGGFDPNALAIAFNDVDFCLKIQAAGYRNLWTPFAEFYHHESASRGFEDTPEKQQRFKTEIETMRARWGALLDRDPAYNPNLSLQAEDFRLREFPDDRY